MFYLIRNVIYNKWQLNVLLFFIAFLPTVECTDSLQLSTT